MAGTIINYLENQGNRSLRDFPLNHVDSLILCQLAYLKFDGLVPDYRENTPTVTLTQLYHHPEYEKLYADERYEKSNRALFEGMLKSRRFRNTKITCYVNIIEKEWETQFSAVTFLLEDGTIYIAFRGTDETIVGWKEDFNMAVLYPVPGQAYSVKYLNAVSSRISGPFYVGGHSKGGNLAVYSAMNCSPRVQERIIKIYSMDGPGFRPEVLEECGYRDIADKIVKIVPHASLVGMLFEWDDRYQVVESRTVGLFQHNPYTWLVKNGHFVETDKIARRSMIVDDTINEWILSLDEEQMKVFVEALFQVFEASQTDNLIDMAADKKKSLNGMISALKEVDESTRNMIRSIMKALLDTYANERYKSRKKSGKKGHDRS